MGWTFWKTKLRYALCVCVCLYIKCVFGPQEHVDSCTLTYLHRLGLTSPQFLLYSCPLSTVSFCAVLPTSPEVFGFVAQHPAANTYHCYLFQSKKFVSQPIYMIFHFEYYLSSPALLQKMWNITNYYKVLMTI